MGWRLKKFFGMQFDILAAYGEVLEKHSNPIEPIELLPAPKDKIKLAIFNEVFQTHVLKDEAYRNALMASFMSLANFQAGAAEAIKIQRLFALSKSAEPSDLVSQLAGSNYGAYQRMLTTTLAELESLQKEWSGTFAAVARRMENEFEAQGRH